MKKKLIFFLLLFTIIGVRAEGEASLKNIKVNGKDCKCVDYSCQIEVDATSAIITYELVDSNAEVDRQSGFSTDLPSPVTTIKIVVKNTLNGEKQENTYEITINKHEKNGDNTINKLKVNDTDITLLDDVYVYNYSSEYDEEKIKVEATPTDPKAKITSSLEFEFPLDRSSISLDFDVEAENGEKNTYRIFVTRGSKPDTTLKSLKLDNGEIKFSPDILDYNLTVDYSINNLLVEAIPNDEKANVKIEKDDLVVGENKVKIIVTNENAESIYTLLVTRAPNLDKSLANLNKLEVVEYPKLDFNPNVLDYTLKFNSIPNSLTINARAKSTDGKIDIIGNENLKNKDKVIVKVTLIETGIVREYTLNIVENKGMSSNKNIIVIAIILLVITIIVMSILDIKDKKKKRHEKLTKIKRLKKEKEKVKSKSKPKDVKKEEEIEII